MLTSWKNQTITYDQIGNPLNYRDGITMTWQNGRELATYSVGTKDVVFKYDPNGLRTMKTVVGAGGNVKYVKYVYEGGLLQQMDYDGYIFNFSYDANGSPVGFHVKEDGYIDAYYYYGLNSRGDVEALYNANGTIYARYEYDAYGKLLGITDVDGYTLSSTYDIAVLNPLRYRSYVYDNETGFYYLQSRYYDPTTCRFINADIYYETGQDINGYNMFAYCNNNPVMYSDPTGTRIFDCCPYGDCYYCRAEKKSTPSSTPSVSTTPAPTNTTSGEVDYGFTHSMSMDVLGIGIGPFSFSVQAGVSIDIEGNIALQITPSVKFGIPGVDSWNFFGGVSGMISNAPNVSTLEGQSVQVGGGISALIPDTPISIFESRDFNFLTTDLGTRYGYSKSKGVSFFSEPGIEGHVGISNTYNILVFEAGGWW